MVGMGYAAQKNLSLWLPPWGSKLMLCDMVTLVPTFSGVRTPRSAEKIIRNHFLWRLGDTKKVFRTPSEPSENCRILPYRSESATPCWSRLCHLSDHRHKELEFRQFTKKLSETSLSRLEKNPLRILDSKDDGDKEILINAPKIHEHLSKESKEYFSKIKMFLSDNGISFQEDDKLVRGLDYYTHTAFEFQTNEEKRQNAILAGGRYDKLINMISTKDIPGIGWAAGIERLMALIPNVNKRNNSSKKILLALQKEEYLNSLDVLKQLYRSDFSHEIKISNNIKKLFTTKF